jgi:hypothetical protein
MNQAGDGIEARVKSNFLTDHEPESADDAEDLLTI